MKIDREKLGRIIEDGGIAGKVWDGVFGKCYSVYFNKYRFDLLYGDKEFVYMDVIREKDLQNLMVGFWWLKETLKKEGVIIEEGDND